MELYHAIYYHLVSGPKARRELQGLSFGKGCCPFLSSTKLTSAALTQVQT